MFLSLIKQFLCLSFDRMWHIMVPTSNKRVTVTDTHSTTEDFFAEYTVSIERRPMFRTYKEERMFK